MIRIAFFPIMILKEIFLIENDVPQNNEMMIFPFSFQ